MFNTTPYEQRFQSTVAHFEEELKKVRTGRAHPSMLDSVLVEAYGQRMPLNQLANITAPEAQILTVTPFDPSNIQVIAAAIRADQSLGLNPSDDGRLVRVPIPALTEERRHQLVKQTSEKSRRRSHCPANDSTRCAERGQADEGCQGTVRRRYEARRKSRLTTS